MIFKFRVKKINCQKMYYNISTVFFASFLAMSSVNAAGYASFGEHCKISENCISGRFLYCNQYKTCDCIQGLGLKHDLVTKMCALPSGTNCHVKEEENEPTCTTGSTCVTPTWGQDPTKGVCSCNRGYQTHPNDKHCVPRIRDGGKCKSDVVPGQFLQECLEFATCKTDSNTCSCASGLIYDRHTQECTLPTGEQCLIDPADQVPTCSSNALCEPNDEPTKGLCTCKPSFENLPERRCLKKIVPIGEYCEANQPANLHSCSNLSNCRNNVCDCSVPGIHVLEDDVTKRCALAVGANCDKVVADPEAEPICISNSECLTLPWDISRRTCVCTNKLFEADPQSKRCIRKIDADSTCEQKSPHKFVRSCIEYASCNSVTNQCDCIKDFETTIEDKSVCKLRGNGLELEPCFLYGTSVCTENSQCVRYSATILEDENPIGFCKCNRGYKSNTELKCVWSPNSYEEDCLTPIECDRFKSISCYGGKCLCITPETMIYDKQQMECLTLAHVNGTCTLQGGEVITKCVQNANCVPKPNDDTVGYCKCATGYEQTDNGFCVKAGNPTTQKPPVSDDPSTQKPPVSDDPTTQKPPVTKDPTTQKPPVSEDRTTQKPPVTTDPTNPSSLPPNGGPVLGPTVFLILLFLL